MDDAGLGEVPIVRMLLQREVVDGVDANVATPQLVLLCNWGDQALQVLALNFFPDVSIFDLAARTTARANCERNVCQAPAQREAAVSAMQRTRTGP